MTIPWAYDLGVALYAFAGRIAAVFNPKARLWVQGRSGWAPALEQAMHAYFPPGDTRIWIHCASLGEFEQGRPLMEALRREYPRARILLSFFSPSGYEIRKEYPLADHVCYLPVDTRAQAEQFVEIVRPDLAVFVKYEFWLHTLAALFRRGIPTLLVSALFRPEQVFFRWYGKAWMEALRGFRHVFVQDDGSEALLKTNGVLQCTVAGDTRVDRVASLAAEGRRIPLVEAFAGGSPVLIAGSTWPPDEKLLAGLISEGFPAEWKMLIAPHHISMNSINRLERILEVPAIRFSTATPETAAAARVLIVDNVGMLAALYRYGKVAYIGGGFGAGIHNTLEPLAFGLPVIFGPKYGKFREAVEMLRDGGASAVRNTDDLRRAFAHFSTQEGRERARRASFRYLEKNKGATAQIMEGVGDVLMC